MATQKRFPTMKLPKPIIAIHNSIDAIEKAKKIRAAQAELIETEKTRIARLCKKNKAKLGKLPNGGILYVLNGYRVEICDVEKITATIEKES